MTPQEFEHVLAAEGITTMAQVERPVGYGLGLHAHPFDAIALITAGEITLVVDGVATRYAVGDVFRLPAGTLHTESAGSDGVRYTAGRREKVGAA